MSLPAGNTTSSLLFFRTVVNFKVLEIYIRPIFHVSKHIRLAV